MNGTTRTTSVPQKAHKGSFCQRAKLFSTSKEDDKKYPNSKFLFQNIQDRKNLHRKNWSGESKELAWPFVKMKMIDLNMAQLEDK